MTTKTLLAPIAHPNGELECPSCHEIGQVYAIHLWPQYSPVSWHDGEFSFLKWKDDAAPVERYLECQGCRTKLAYDEPTAQ